MDCQTVMQNTGPSTNLDGAFGQRLPSWIVNDCQRVAHNTRWSVGQYPEFVRSGYMADTSVFDGGVVERNPCTDHLVWLEWPIGHVLMAGHHGTD